MSSSKTIAIIGASNNREKYGNKAVRAYRDQGYEVYPVNPKEQTIEGLPCFASVLDIPGEVETASLYLPPNQTRLALDELAQKKVETIFLNPGSSDDTVMRRAKELGLNVIVACSIVAVGKTPMQYE